jgi:transcriptional regulator with XRE-family HTH domain
MADRSLKRTRKDLSDFLLHHRRKLTPADVGLPSTERRRTPGLRREEVAALAGVGLSWYTWFEQGRDIHVSEKFLLNIAYALKLDDAECSHLFLLAHRRPPSPEARQPTSVSAGIQQLLDELPRPAYVHNLRWDAIAWNTAADDLFRFGSKLPEERNVLELVFADSSMRRRMPAWGDDAAGLLAQLRYDVAVAPDDPLMLDLIETLRLLSPGFRQEWEAPHRVVAQRGISHLLDSSGTLHRYRHETLIVDEHRHLRMVVYFQT